MAFTILTLIYGGFFTLIIILKLIFGQNRHKGKFLQNGNFEALFSTLGYYYFSGAFITFFTGIFACWKKIGQEQVDGSYEGGECSEISVLIFFSMTLFWIPLTKIYFAVKADYSRRISISDFGCKKNNNSNSSAYLLQMFTIFFFYLLDPYLGILESTLILAFGIYFSFFLKLKSEEYICQKIRLIEVSSSLLSTLTLTALILLIVRINFIIF